MSIHHGLGCKLGGTTLPVICETKVEIMDATWPADRQWCHQPREWEDCLLITESDIVWSKRQHYAIYRPHPLYSPCMSAVATLAIDDVIRGMQMCLTRTCPTSVTATWFSSPLILTARQRAYCIPLLKMKAVDDMIKNRYNPDVNITMGGPVTLTPQKDGTYLDLPH